MEHLANPQGKRPHLEIHCHGDPAQLHLGSPGRVNVATVRWFGNRLARCLRPGGQIELLACKVASQGQHALHDLNECDPRNIKGYHPAYHDALRLRKNRNYQLSKSCPDNLPVYGGSYKTFPSMSAEQRSQYFKLMADPTTTTKAKVLATGYAIEDLPNKKFDPRPESDGLQFCLSLANSSGCVVRAPVFSQVEDEARKSWSQTPIGNWEYEVFDFLPNGDIRFLGSSPYRGPLMDSFDLDRFNAV